MRIVFCDDNKEITALLKRYVFEFFESAKVKLPEYAEYDSGDALLEHEGRVDIAFLDVEMPGMSGIYVGDALKKRNPWVKIFIVTSYSDYLDEAMKYQVFRYISKPVDKNRLFRNLKDAVRQISTETKEIAIETVDGIVVRRAEEIVYAEATQRKVLIHTVGDTFVSTKKFEYWQHTLVLPCFFRTHRSYIVNMRFVNAVEKDRVILRHNDKLDVAYLTRRKYTEFKNTYLIYMESIR